MEPGARARRWAARTTQARRRVCSAGSAPSAPVSMRASWGTACHQASHLSGTVITVRPPVYR